MSASIGLSAPYVAIRDGEFFRYRAGWGIFARAGEIEVSARYSPAGTSPATVNLAMTTSTRGIVQRFYRYTDRSEALIDASSGRIQTASNRSTGGDQPINANVRFDYDARMAYYRDSGNPNRNRDIRIPDGDPVDLLSALIQTRDWNLRPGDRREALIYASRDIYPVVIYAEKFETISTPAGDKETLVLVPRMETEKPRGIFRQGGEIKVWVENGGQRLPVKMTLKLKFGVATLLLQEHGVLPPASPTQTAKGESPETTPTVPRT